MSYSIDFRCKVIFTMEEEGLSIRETAKHLSSILHLYQQVLDFNKIEPKTSTTRRRKIDKSELIKDIEYNIQMLTKKSVQSVLAFVRRPFGKFLKNGIDL
ncbi:IS630 transposase-related protein [Arsenophonus endosymbiont of Bemisia tabaci]|uniref:IS630 transposase-related protein n=1 Tax=Arsenophonus endosymbiont of Bemisia tabaci TaxID=536059 RepID=UPI0015F479C5|nr:IS630 transposase-related protein [Arsenophonus endosymbiont of Bemisia tabaci]CAA2930551.1 hypothetical protein ARSQ2_01684 [Arsenophonus endosymbiont of Bemisia tabaci Q2]